MARLSTLDRVRGALLGAYLGETTGEGASTPRTRLLVLPPEKTLPAPDLLPSEALLFALVSGVLTGRECPGGGWEEGEKARSLSEEALAAVRTGALAVSSIAFERTGLENLLPTLLGTGGKTPLLSRLERARAAIEEGRSLREAIGRPPGGDPLGTAIAISLLAFLRTPEDFNLSAGLVGGVPCPRPLTATLVGLWSGLYNGYHGLPIARRWRVSRQSLPRDLETRAREIHALWSGVDPKNGLPSPTAAIGPGGTIQPRANFRALSREDSLDFSPTCRSPYPL